MSPAGHQIINPPNQTKTTTRQNPQPIPTPARTARRPRHRLFNPRPKNRPPQAPPSLQKMVPSSRRKLLLLSPEKPRNRRRMGLRNEKRQRSEDDMAWIRPHEPPLATAATCPQRILRSRRFWLRRFERMPPLFIRRKGSDQRVDETSGVLQCPD